MSTTRSEGSFQITSWEEDVIAGADGTAPLREARVTQELTGDIEGKGAVRWLMFHRADGTADFVGLQHIAGRIGGRSGSFVLRSEGTFDGTTAAGDWSVVPGSATGELEGLAGRGRMEAPMGSRATYTLDHEL